MRRKNIVWGLGLILIAVLLVLSATDLIPAFSTFAGEIAWEIALICFVLLLYAIAKLAKGKIGGIFLPLAFIFMLLEKNIAALCGLAESNIINNWLLLLCAVLLKIGFSLIFKKKNKKKKQEHTFSSAVVYVDLAKNESRQFSNQLGELTIRFENTGHYEGKTTIYIDNKLGETVIEVPSNLYYICNIKNKLGDLSLQKNAADASAPTIILEGENKLGEVTVKIV